MSKRYDGSQRALDLKGLRVDPGGLLERSWKGCRGVGRVLEGCEVGWEVLEGQGMSWKGAGRV